MSAPLFRAQHRGDNGKLIHYWIRINIQAENINSQPQGGNAECVKILKQTKNKKARDPWPKIPSRVHYFTASCSLVSAFCLISVLIFIMIFYRRARARGSWRAACCFWLFSSLSSGFKIWIWIFMIENNGGYKNKSLQSWAVSYRGKQCLPHQRSLEMLASSLLPVEAYSASSRPAESLVLLKMKDPEVSLSIRVLTSLKTTREKKSAIRVTSLDLFQM